MSKQGLTVTVRMHAKAGMEQQLRKALIDLIAPSRAEDGCLSYFIQQSLDDPQVFLFYMNWQDEETFSRHIRSDHVKLFDDQIAGQLLIEPYTLSHWVLLG
jgi:quinol monooxygenase YgiN